MKIHPRAGIIASSFLCLTLAACTGEPQRSDSQAHLEERLSTLEQENNALRAEVQALKAQIPALSAPTALSAPAALSGPTALSAPAALSGIRATASANPRVTTTPAESVHYLDLSDCPGKNMIEELAGLGVFGGDKANFQPEKPITRAQYITWLYNAHNAIVPEAQQIHPASQKEPIFPDVPESHPAFKYIQAMACAGYSIGYEDGKFYPDKALTRQEMIAIKVGVDCGKSIEPWRSQMEAVWKFADSKKVDERYTGYIHQDYYVSGPHGSNIMRAFGKLGSFHPQQAVLRCEAASTLWQFGQFGNTQPMNANLALQNNSGSLNR